MERRAPDAPGPDASLPDASPSGTSLPNGFLFWPVALVVVFVDVVTKAIAAAALAPALIPHPVIGEVARLTLVYNRGAAFGIHVGAYSRPIFAKIQPHRSEAESCPKKEVGSFEALQFQKMTLMVTVSTIWLKTVEPVARSHR